MNCPDTDFLIDAAQSGKVDSELEAHLASCPSCQLDFQLISELPAVFRPEAATPERLVQKTMASLFPKPAEAKSRWPDAAHGVVAAALGMVTFVVAAAATGAAGAGGVKGLLLFSVGMGLVMGLRESRLGGEA